VVSPGPPYPVVVERIWLGMVRSAGEWEPAAVFPGDADGLRAAVEWLARPLGPGETSRAIRRWDVQGSGDTPGGQPGRPGGPG
jgi:hypothetical protein